MANESQVLEITGSETDKRPTAQVALVISAIEGYDAGETQTLKHDEGALQWVTDAG